MAQQQAAKKLMMRYKLGSRIAQALVEANFRTPTLIRVASDEELAQIPGIEAEDVKQIREKVG